MARRRILVSGATDGIGLALVKRLAPRHDVIATGRREYEAALKVLPEGVIYIRADQSDPVEAAKAAGRGLLENGLRQLDFAVLNAGVGRAGAPQEETPASIRQTLDINLAGTIAMAHMMYPFLKPAKGQLTIIGSVARKGSARFATYAASKAGLFGLARALEAEWRGVVHVQCLDPGPTRTDMQSKAGLETGSRRWFVPVDAMAAMLEGAIRTGETPRALSALRYWSGGAVLRRSIR